MRAIPYAGVQAFRTLAARTALVRALLAVVLVVLVLAAALSVRSPHAAAQPFLPPRAGGVVVLDLSASITSDTYSRIHNTLAQLVSRGGRYGLVVFSNVAYEALPPGSPASALAPLIRYFAVPSKVAPGEQPTFPVNPWTASFTSGTAISAGLDLARRIELQSHVRRPAVVLVSDLADDPNDIQRLSAVLGDYRAQHVGLRAIALNAAPSDQAFFEKLLGKASAIIPAGLSTANPTTAGPPSTSFPVWLAVATAVVAALLAVNELRSARLRWGGAAVEGTG
jgi:hypothetical protein